MTPWESVNKRGQSISRRPLLRNGIIVAGSLALGGVGITKAKDEPQTWSKSPRWAQYTPCTDEMADVTGGTQRYLLHIHEDGNGGKHLNFQTHWNPEITIVGRETGFTWTAMNTKNWTEYIDPSDGYPWTGTFMSTTTGTSKDTQIVVMLRLRNQLTINANGDMTNFHQQFEIRCRGSDAE